MVETILPVELQNAIVRKGTKDIIGPLNLTFGGKGCSIVIGPNGAGKTTLLRLLHGLERTTSGTVRWAARKGDTYSRQSFVFQAPVVLRRSGIENIAYPLYVRGVVKKAARAEAEKWIGDIGLRDVGNNDASVLSGGEKQKLAMARALITKPEVLFLDEPTANLDGAATLEIEGLIRAAVEAGTRVIMATHDFGQARRLATEILFMYHGKVHERATADTFFDDPQSEEARKFLRGDLLV
ncbi:ATP-binding cassette domain-containing protein [Sneathiella sp. CAU 1612]|uniref:ATP-binding cassette domain-containing protein n=1 Tax=Sneathiella sedimenti TaxID=2816034 RepID=A0ABS3F6G1_9PROT|nr:ATP-binding cassette domain-containing protein [Sneathiella sedimenti]MBO0334114.1 ATP-binding cassette domain-containing protein [Sneathiella sedimenti]